ncbi:MAG TPA: nucleotidyl transferase AbiEii/AbiGii toxin family protein [Pyrinomonadaceae bacterium]|nr:nucleotidyl transferase AbiEii/AbiGii toxin family protein [Pyrinomonadaceae bacterium]
MPKRPLKNVPASVHQRLLNLARETKRPFNELLQYFAIERFLFRFSRSEYADRYVLKGAQMLQAWNAPLARPTMDIDMLGRKPSTIAALENVIREVIAVEVEPDAVVFDPKTVSGEAIVKSAAYEGVRIRFRGTLGKIKLNVQLDFAFGDLVVPAPMPIELPDLIGLGAPRLLGYTPESAIAEKYQAMVALDITNTRIKDFYDVWLLSQTIEFDGAVLAEAIAVTFKQRSTPLPTEPPMALTEQFGEAADKQVLWRAFLRKGRLDAQGKQLGEIVAELREFLWPPTAAAQASDPFRKRWRGAQWHP